jgi:hypothetical protein
MSESKSDADTVTIGIDGGMRIPSQRLKPAAERDDDPGFLLG